LSSLLAALSFFPFAFKTSELFDDFSFLPRLSVAFDSFSFAPLVDSEGCPRDSLSPVVSSLAFFLERFVFSAASAFCGESGFFLAFLFFWDFVVAGVAGVSESFRFGAMDFSLATGESGFFLAFVFFWDFVVAGVAGVSESFRFGAMDFSLATFSSSASNAVLEVSRACLDIDIGAGSWAGSWARRRRRL
jgi:hypothetical protein